MKVKDIYTFIDSFAPFDSAISYDNVGILAGNAAGTVTKAGVCLDITKNTIDQAKKAGCDLIISHHPVIFPTVFSVLYNSPLYALIQSGIPAICAHTNLDAANGGVNDCLLESLELTKTGVMEEEGLAVGRIGVWNRAKTPDEAATFIKQKLGCKAVRLLSAEKPIQTVAVCGGAGGDFIGMAIEQKADAMVTSEIKHHEWLAANGEITLIDAGHFLTEQVIVKPLAEKIAAHFAGLTCVVLDEIEPYDYR